MTEREFIDEDGTTWRARVTLPTDRVATTLPSSFQDGWLTFASDGGEHRRLAPVPPGWEEAADGVLERLCRAATPARRTDTPSGLGRAWVPPEPESR